MEHEYNSSYYDKSYKLLILGDPAVGKTSIIRAFNDQEHIAGMFHSIGYNNCPKTLDYLELKICLDIWDCPGQSYMSTAITPIYKNVYGLVFVFDVNQHSTFENIPVWIRDFKRFSGIEYIDALPKILVGNKTDLPRFVAHEMAKKFADNNKMEYIETSAKNNENIRKIFLRLLKQLTEYRPSLRDFYICRNGVQAGKPKTKKKRSWCPCGRDYTA